MPKRIITKLNTWFNRATIVTNLEVFQDIIIISLCVGLFCVMFIRLGDMFLSFLHPLDLREVTSDILFILILVELFRLLIDYLQTQKISVGAAAEITIVSALREVILRGVLEIPRDQIFGISLFLLVLTAILIALPWISGFFHHVRITNAEISADDTDLLSNTSINAD
ncbi:MULTISPECIES: phosphate-starvation-inducible PsiE family protein [unclassified Anabaena]|uniref:phosphate-starvation-inducible PsiE family protein n=1 Tax=unclassified Anabaena TaxID=2619674 RepID=UPI0016862044|nr:phosphate-starvation-inducible PsiE family protein [Anabaena sp. UHCC 0399]MBD2363704.1 phosphate-starvation-inducible PsiE family protein [Anabaena minutissima FACHB-250]MEA5568325.1 phosphate-starvation-inducible PsiE family protein [Anabaena sp. UHCC 0399]